MNSFCREELKCTYDADGALCLNAHPCHQIFMLRSRVYPEILGLSMVPLEKLLLLRLAQHVLLFLFKNGYEYLNAISLQS